LFKTKIKKNSDPEKQKQKNNNLKGIVGVMWNKLLYSVKQVASLPVQVKLLCCALLKGGVKLKALLG